MQISDATPLISAIHQSRDSNASMSLGFFLLWDDQICSIKSQEVNQPFGYRGGKYPLQLKTADGRARITAFHKVSGIIRF